MTQNISKTPEITTKHIQIALGDLAQLGNSNDLTKYLVAKCLSNDKTEDPSLTEYLNGLKEKLAYKYFQSNLLFEPLSYLLSLKRNNSHIRLIDKEMLPINEIIPFTFSDGNIQTKDLFSSSRLIVGDPGAGKSTLLRYLLYSAYELFNKGLINNIPILIDLDLYEDNIIEGIHNSLKINGYSVENVKSLLANGNVTLLVDEFDFVNDKESCLREIQKLKNLSSDNSIIITCRLENILKSHEIPCLEIKAYDIEDISNFLTLHLTGKSLEVLIQDVKSKDYGNILRNPLILWATILLIKKHPSEVIVQRIGVVLQNILENYFIGLWGTKRNVHAYNISSKEEVLVECLEMIAYEMMNSGNTNERWIRKALGKQLVEMKDNCEIFELSANEIISIALKSNILLKNNIKEKIRFSHDLFRDYFVSKKILYEWDTKKEINEQFISEYKWHTSVLLMIDLVEDKIGVVNYIMPQNVLLAARCYFVSRIDLESVRSKLVREIIDSKQFDYQSCAIVCNIKKEVDINLFLKLADNSDSFTKDFGYTCLGGFHRDDIIDMLIQALAFSGKYVLVKSSAIGILGRMKVKRAVKRLLKEYFSDRGSSDFDPVYININKDLISSLHQIIPDELENIFLNECASEEVLFRNKAIDGLYVINSGKSIDMLARMLHDSETVVSNNALSAIALIASEDKISNVVTNKAIDILLNVYNNKKYSGWITGSPIINCFANARNRKSCDFFGSVLSNEKEGITIISESMTLICEKFTDTERNMIFRKAIVKLDKKLNKIKNEIDIIRSEILIKIYKHFLSGKIIYINVGAIEESESDADKYIEIFIIKDRNSGEKTVIRYPSRGKHKPEDDCIEFDIRNVENWFHVWP